MNKYTLGKGRNFNVGSLNGETVIYRKGDYGNYIRKFNGKLTEESLLGYGDEVIYLSDAKLLRRDKSRLQIL